MGTTPYHTATTLDGYIADKNNSLDWLFQADRETGESSHYDRFFAGVGGDRNIHPLLPMVARLLVLMNMRVNE